MNYFIIRGKTLENAIQWNRFFLFYRNIWTFIWAYNRKLFHSFLQIKRVLKAALESFIFYFRMVLLNSCQKKYFCIMHVVAIIYWDHASADRKALYIMHTVAAIGKKCMYCDPQGENLALPIFEIMWKKTYSYPYYWYNAK
jgi:hypothetical protein